MMDRYLENEIQILKKIEHKNIVKFLKIEKSSSNYALAFEYCAGKDLNSFIKEHGPLSEP